MGRLTDYQRGTIFGAVIVALAFSFAFSRTSQIAQQPGSTHGQEEAAQVQASEPSHREFWDWITHDASGFFASFAILISGVQAGLFFWQLRKMDDSLDATIDAASAADRSSRAAEATLRNTERPYVFVFNVSSLKGERFLTVTYSVANYGKLPAIIEEQRIGFVFSPVERPSVGGAESLALAPILAPGELRIDLKAYLPEGLADGGMVISFDPDDTPRQPTPTIRLPESTDLFFKAQVSYRGPFTSSHETGALWRFEADDNMLSAWGNEQHNYIR